MKNKRQVLEMLDEVIKNLDRARATVQLRLVKLGYDYETHGGLEVRFKGPVPEGLGRSGGSFYPPIGTQGTVAFTKKVLFGWDECVQVEWKPWRKSVYHVTYQSWAELEVVRQERAAE